MKCPFCSSAESKVLDSRVSDDNTKIRRRRECMACQKRFTTFETVETIPLIVVKKDKSHELFNRQKLINSILRSCDKSTIDIKTIENAVEKIQNKLENSLDREVPSEKIGELALQALKSIDQVAYIRFASVYRNFKDVNSFFEELEKLTNSK